MNKRLERIEKNGGLAARYKGVPPRPSIASVSTVGNPALGNINAPVTLVEFTDYQCPFCKRFANGAFLELKKIHRYQKIAPSAPKFAIIIS